MSSPNILYVLMKLIGSTRPIYTRYHRRLVALCYYNIFLWLGTYLFNGRMASIDDEVHLQRAYQRFVKKVQRDSDGVRAVGHERVKRR